MKNRLLVILNSLATNSPLLCAWGLYLPKPIAITMEEDINPYHVISELSHRPVCIDTGRQIKKAEAEIKEANSEAIVLLLPPKILRDTVKLSKQIEMLLEYPQKPRKLGEAVGLPIIISNFITDDLRDSVFEIFMSDFSDQDADYDVNIVPPAEKLAVIEEKLEADFDLPVVQRVLRAAVACMYPWFKENGELAEYQKMLDLADEVFFSVTEDQDLSSIVNHIKRLITCAVVSDEYLLMNEGDTVDCIDKTFLFDEYSDVLWLNYRTFQKIIEPIRNMCKKSDIKRALACSDFINNRECGNYIKRKTIHTSQDSVREYMVQINAQKIIIPDPEVHLTLVDLIRNKIAGGEKCQI